MTRKHFVLAMAISPLSPLTKYTKIRIAKRCFASLNMTSFQLSLRGEAEAIKRRRIPMILASHTVGCRARTLCSLAMTKIDVKILEVRL